jgi:hypothetical protein
MTNLRSIGLVCVALAAACGTTSGFMQLNPPPRPLHPRQPSQVLMFTSSAPTERYVEVGLITTAISDWSSENELEILAALREEAAKHGCEGVVVTDENKMATATHNYGWSTAKERTAGFRAVCIAFLPRSAESVAPAPAPVPSPAPVYPPAPAPSAIVNPGGAPPAPASAATAP